MGTDKLSLHLTKDASCVESNPVAQSSVGTILEHVSAVCKTIADEVWLLTSPDTERVVSQLAKNGQAVSHIVRKQGHISPVTQQDLAHVTQQAPGRVRVVADDEFYAGPLRALAHAWSLLREQSANSEAMLTQADSYVFIVAGDLPGLTSEVLIACKSKLDQGTDDVDAVLVTRDGMLQPLLGCYRLRAGRVFVNALDEGEKRILPALRELSVETVSPEDCHWPEWWTRPVHTPGDYEDWLMARGSAK